jgi:hypothetical protein
MDGKRPAPGRRGRTAVAAAMALFTAASTTGCTVVSKVAYTPSELRAEVARRAPSIPGREIVVPFEVTPAQVGLARKVVAEARSDEDRVRALTEALFDPGGFGLRYASTVTASAEETLSSSEGNCLALASVFIGLARGIGLKAYYMDASTRVHETRYHNDGMTVNAGHVTALVKTGDGDIGLDFERLGQIRWYRAIDDLEALAHFYNNRGFDLIDRAQERGLEADWTEVAHDFWLAVQVMPTFARAWNNLGIAAARLGRAEEAVQDYRTAIARDPKLAAPLNNLGSLHLQSGDVEAALQALEAAARLEPRGAHIQYNLAVARHRHGDRLGAVEALRRAIDLRGVYPEAQALLDQLTLQAARSP